VTFGAYCNKTSIGYPLSVIINHAVCTEQIPEPSQLVTSAENELRFNSFWLFARPQNYFRFKRASLAAVFSVSDKLKLVRSSAQSYRPNRVLRKFWTDVWDANSKNELLSQNSMTPSIYFAISHSRNAFKWNSDILYYIICQTAGRTWIRIISSANSSYSLR